MLYENSLEDTANVGRRIEITTFEQVPVSQTRPIGMDPATPVRAAEQQGGARHGKGGRAEPLGRGQGLPEQLAGIRVAAPAPTAEGTERRAAQVIGPRDRDRATMRLLLHLPLRQTEGFLISIFELMGLHLDAPRLVMIVSQAQFDAPIASAPSSDRTRGVSTPDPRPRKSSEPGGCALPTLLGQRRHRLRRQSHGDAKQLTVTTI